MKRVIASLASLFILSSCTSTKSQNSETKLVPLTSEQANQDLEAIISNLTSLYGPMQYKEKRFGYKLSELSTAARTEMAAAQTEEERFAVIMRLLAKLKDGHIKLDIVGNASNVERYAVQVFLTPVEGHAIVAQVGPTASSLFGVELGDEVVTIDGKSPFDFLPTINKYQTFGNELTDKHFLFSALNRPFYIPELAPTNSQVQLTLKKPNGTTYSAVLPWQKSKFNAIADIVAPQARFNYVTAHMKELNSAAQGSVAEMGARNPYFVSPASKAALGLVEVSPNEESLARFGLTSADVTVDGKFCFYAATYRHAGKNILLIRQATYSAPIPKDKMIKAYMALMSQYENLSDVLVIDQNHNPGGDLEYASNFFQLLIKPGEQKSSQTNFLHADRKWVFDLTKFANESSDATEKEFLRFRAGVVDTAVNEGKFLTPPISLVAPELLGPNTLYSWKKPFIVLADELSGSCGDVFPMLIKRNKMAKIIGERTIGLGGNVEVVETLPQSRSVLHLTRGLFSTYRADGQYTDEDLIENVGVQPDIQLKPTLADFRAGFTEYLTKVSDLAVAEVPAQ